MLKSPRTPTCLTDAVTYFADPDRALEFLVELRWPQGVTCPHCGAPEPSFLKSRRIWKCRAKPCRKQFSIKVGTIFEDSPLGLDKWLPALWLIANAKNGISSYEVARALGVTQKTAWFMLGRIRAAMEYAGGDPFSGEVEIDETFVGGRYEYMHKSKRDRLGGGSAGQNKVAITGILERGRIESQRAKGKRGASRVRVTLTKSLLDTKGLFAHVQGTVRPGSAVYSDEAREYGILSNAYARQVVNHSHEYVRGRVHTNGIENFWSLLKRTIKGTYVSIDPFHTLRYIDEQVFRFNNRRAGDGERFVAVLAALVGKRLTYRELTGADLATT
jgi:transposase-like protein